MNDLLHRKEQVNHLKVSLTLCQKSKVKTMKAGKPLVKCKSKEVPIGREEMYLRPLAINSFKKVPLERVMSIENAPVPLSLFDDHGKTVAKKK